MTFGSVLTTSCTACGEKMDEDFQWNYDQQNIQLLTERIRIALSGSGILLNLLVIIGTVSHKCKTSIKFVLSLAFADLLLSAFHLTYQFITFVSPWADDEQTVFTMENNNVNFSNPGLLGIRWTVRSGPPPMFEDLPGKTINLNDYPILDGSDATHFISVMRNLTDLPIDLNLSAFDFNYFGETKPESMLQKWLSAFYLMPNIACVLSMFCITTGLLTTVTNPLKSHILLSKKRGNIVTLSVWLFSFAVALGVFVYIAYKEPANRNLYHTPVVHYVSSIIWYVTFLVFAMIAVMYGIVIYFLVCKRISSASSNTQLTRKTNVRATVTAIAVTGSYAVCFLPFVWYKVLQELELYSPFGESFIWIEGMQIMFILNTNLDAVIYALRLPEVSNGLKKKVQFLMCKKNVN